MRPQLTGLVIGVVAMVAAVVVQSQDAAAVLSATRAALGGGSTLDAVTSFTISGSMTRTIGAFVNSESLEITGVLPDKFLQVSRRTVDTPGNSFTMSHFDGFNGNEPIHEIVAPLATFPVVIPGPQPSTAAEAVAAQERRLHRARHLFTRLSLPLFAASMPAYPLVFAFGGEAQLPSGRAEVVEAKGPDGFAWKLFIDATTHLPARLTWMDKPIIVASTTSTVKVSPRGDVTPVERGGGLPPGDPTAGLSDVVWEMTIADYRVGDGVNWPRRMTTTVGGQRHEEIRISRVRINPKIDPRTFVVPKGSSR